MGGQQSARRAPLVDFLPTMVGGSAQHPLLSNKGGREGDSRADVAAVCDSILAVWHAD